MTLYWTQGKANVVADALSRAPVWPAQEEADILACAARVAMARKPQDEILAELAQKASEDPDYQAIYQALRAGKVPKNLPRRHPAQSVGTAWNNLSLEAELPSLIFHMGRIWVPPKGRGQISTRGSTYHMWVKRRL